MSFLPAWLETAVSAATPLVSKAEGLMKIGQAIEAEISGGDDPVDKAIRVAGEVESAFEQIMSAVHANTAPAVAHEPAAAEPAPAPDHTPAEPALPAEPAPAEPAAS